MMSACLVAALLTADSYLFEMGVWLALHFGCLLAGFVIHELGHAVTARICPGVVDLHVSVNIFRFSLSPVGTLFGWQVALISLVGPFSSCLAGALLLLTAPGLSVHYWFLLHLVFLAPAFGDGRSLIVGLRKWSSPIQLQAP